MTAADPSAQTRLLFFAGSAREKSWNKKLAKLGENIADANGIKATFADLADYPMPIYCGDIELRDGPLAVCLQGHGPNSRGAHPLAPNGSRVERRGTIAAPRSGPLTPNASARMN